MTTIKSYTDIEQSKKLAEILPLESADMCYGINDDTLKYNNLPWLMPYHGYTAKEFYIPCWSLAALLSIIPIEHDLHDYLNENGMEYRIETLYAGNSKSYDNPVDACVGMILKLHELNSL